MSLEWIPRTETQLDSVCRGAHPLVLIWFSPRFVHESRKGGWTLPRSFLLSACPERYISASPCLSDDRLPHGRARLGYLITVVPKMAAL